ncbi:MAG TPA: hypothetical protein DEB17_03255 [Chlorobaculum sp.]|uniref:Uncharacterized protein n=1 Tax=Chlorobaculum tepidum (strain ATCC 49652 / DSM 12025 / NBRC 103806 / TLS) TaxID=194439 RepID=Q8KE40_CHLTE|nr:hypothetical protein CT0850 [Chlorobaculum tepidum TLS]HBU23004.1 hypothetical protein [Chlorobaculum sp.]
MTIVFRHEASCSRLPQGNQKRKECALKAEKIGKKKSTLNSMVPG